MKLFNRAETVKKITQNKPNVINNRKNYLYDQSSEQGITFVARKNEHQ
jgi:hypothetical protein